MSELRATFRLHCHGGFTFDEAASHLPYLRALGISHLYLSPVLTPVAGSTHGYDLADPQHINPEAGGEPALRRLAEAARQQGMQLIIDVVANHMAANPQNPWWDHVLRWGPASPHAGLFDIDWAAGEDRLVLPVLPAPYGESLAQGRLRLAYQRDTGEFRLGPDGLSLPVCPLSYCLLLGETGEPALMVLGARLAALASQPGAPEQAAPLCQALRELGEDAALHDALQRACQRFQHPDEELTQRWHRLLSRQHYRLVHWRSGPDLLNWRRFFDINELVAVRGNQPEVFELMHAALWPLARDGLLDGLRVDHVDGLADPRDYCRALRLRLAAEWQGEGPGPWLFVEKILATDEALPHDWLVDGSTGYEFMEQVSLLLHDARGGPRLAALWAGVSDQQADLAQARQEARATVLDSSLVCDLERVTRCFSALAASQLATCDLAPAALRRVLRALALAMPVYRLYGQTHRRDSADQRWLRIAVRRARAALAITDHRVLAQVEGWLSEDPTASAAPDLLREAAARFGQLTAPLAAKGIEDTLCYREGMLLSRNEVGADPERLAADAATFHAHCRQRAEQWPDTLLATATHDHKRGEDCRARLAVLSERAEEFSVQWSHWAVLARPLMHSDRIPHPADLMMLFQTMLGSWPMTLTRRDSPESARYLRRLLGWQTKALREARLRSHWLMPDEDYEHHCASFLGELFLEARGAPLWKALCQAAHGLMVPGALNSLTQCLLRLTTPGVPDLYQGGDNWDLSLVDPDNRRTPDLPARARMLERPATPASLLADWRDGHIKQWLIARLLGFRARQPALFRHGDYQPLTITGEAPAEVLAFIRRHQGRALVVLAPYHAAAALREATVPHIPPDAWGESRLTLPADLHPHSLVNLLTGVPLSEPGPAPRLSALLGHFPVAAFAGRHTPSAEEENPP